MSQWQPHAGASVAVPLRVPVEWVWPSVPALPGASLRLRQQDLPQHVLYGAGSTPCYILYLMILCRKITIHINAILILLSNYFHLPPARKAAVPEPGVGRVQEALRRVRPGGHQGGQELHVQKIIFIQEKAICLNILILFKD